MAAAGPLNNPGGVPGGPCAHCGATESPQWRRPLAKKVVLCNACGIYYSRHHALPKRKKVRGAAVLVLVPENCAVGLSHTPCRASVCGDSGLLKPVPLTAIARPHSILQGPQPRWAAPQQQPQPQVPPPPMAWPPDHTMAFAAMPLSVRVPATVAAAASAHHPLLSQQQSMELDTPHALPSAPPSTPSAAFAAVQTQHVLNRPSYLSPAAVTVVSPLRPVGPGQDSRAATEASPPAGATPSKASPDPTPATSKSPLLTAVATAAVPAATMVHSSLSTPAHSGGAGRSGAGSPTREASHEEVHAPSAGASEVQEGSVASTQQHLHAWQQQAQATAMGAPVFISAMPTSRKRRPVGRPTPTPPAPAPATRQVTSDSGIPQPTAAAWALPTVSQALQLKRLNPGPPQNPVQRPTITTEVGAAASTAPAPLLPPTLSAPVPQSVGDAVSRLLLRSCSSLDATTAIASAWQQLAAALGPSSASSAVRPSTPPESVGGSTGSTAPGPAPAHPLALALAAAAAAAAAASRSTALPAAPQMPALRTPTSSVTGGGARVGAAGAAAAQPAASTTPAVAAAVASSPAPPAAGVPPEHTAESGTASQPQPVVQQQPQPSPQQQPGGSILLPVRTARGPRLHAAASRV